MRSGENRPCAQRSVQGMQTMTHDDRTDIGGIQETFLTTHWSLIEAVGASDDDRRKALLGLLLNRYWKPVYCYLRRKGYNNEDAKDLTQGFFQEVVLGRKVIEKADRSKGRFRTFLLTALDNYVINVHTAETAQKHPQAQACFLRPDRPT